VVLRFQNLREKIKESLWFFDFRMSEKTKTGTTLVLECQETETGSSLMVEIKQEPEVL
jgi:hypothetical protein